MFCSMRERLNRNLVSNRIFMEPFGFLKNSVGYKQIQNENDNGENEWVDM